MGMPERHTGKSCLLLYLIFPLLVLSSPPPLLLRCCCYIEGSQLAYKTVKSEMLFYFFYLWVSLLVLLSVAELKRLITTLLDYMHVSSKQNLRLMRPLKLKVRKFD